MRLQRHNAVQVHPVPSHIVTPQGPFPREMFAEPEIIDNYDPEASEDGSNFPIGATAQNNFKSPRIMICSHCEARVPENKTGDHTCGA